MKITLQQPFSISESPTGINSSEIIYPYTQSVSSQNRLFISCSGNTNQAIIAGQTVCDAIEGYFHSFLEERASISPDFIEKAIRFAEISLDEVKREYPQAVGIQTSLSMLFFADDCVYLCQIGKSHIYQVRNNQIVYKSIEQSADRCLKGSASQVELNIVLLKDIKPDDYFFVYAGEFNDNDIEETVCSILSQNESTEEKLTQIKKAYFNKFNTNFSAHLIPVKDIHDNTSYLRRKMNSLVNSFV